jgi:hypothetical protein
MTTKIATSCALNLPRHNHPLTYHFLCYFPSDLPSRSTLCKGGFGVVLLRELRPFLVAWWTAPHLRSMTHILMAMSSSSSTVQQQAQPEP